MKKAPPICLFLLINASIVFAEESMPDLKLQNLENGLSFIRLLSDTTVSVLLLPMD